MNNLTGKIALITGATAGIGKETAAALASMGAQVVVAGRSGEKAQATVQAIRRATGNDRVDYLLADFADLEQVRAMAQAYKDNYTHLDILVNNAGGYFNSRRLNPAGVELTFLVNHLAPFVLTTALLDMIRSTKAARIVNVSSAAHVYDSMDFEDLFFRRGFFGMKAYARSKLANILFTYELARRLEGTGVTVNAMHPGTVTTDIWVNDFPRFGRLFKWLIGRRGLTPEQGADTIIYLAASAEVDGVTGKYYIKRKAAPSSKASYDEAAQRRLWAESERLTGIRVDGEGLIADAAPGATAARRAPGG